MQGYKPGAECSECKGQCCKDKGCSLAPEDMLKELNKEDGELRDQILTLLNDENGLYAIDYFSEEAGPCFYLRMRHKCYNFIGVDAMGECVALTETGCRLSPEKRPKGGRYLESKPDRKCVQHYSREQMCTDWAPYSDILQSIWKEYHAKFEEDGTFDKCDDAYFAWLKEIREKNKDFL